MTGAENGDQGWTVNSCRGAHLMREWRAAQAELDGRVRLPMDVINNATTSWVLDPRKKFSCAGCLCANICSEYGDIACSCWCSNQ
jgi:hypothetical protein